MKKYTIKHYKGNLLESVKKFQDSHKDMKIVEASEVDGDLAILASPMSVPADDSTANSDSYENQEEFVGGGQVSNISAFGAKLLSFGLEVHFWHLNCSKNSEHLALKDLYEACDDVGDRILEAAIGQMGQNATYVPVDVDFKSNYDPTEAIAKIEAIRTEAGSFVGTCDEGFNNILGEFCETCNSIVYKLKRLS